MTVQRKHNKFVTTVSCQLTIPDYNKNMQGVDWHDKLRAKYDLSSIHRFKRYYITHQLAKMDIGITNSCIYHALANPKLKKKNGHIL
jgi:hypothetical protein